MAIVSLQLVLQDALDPIDAVDVDVLHALGIVLAALGGLSVFAAQLGMGENWRVGVSDEQGTDLVTGGWFSLCRNPIYAAMIVGWTGFALMVPTWLAFAAVVVIVLGLELQGEQLEFPIRADDRIRWPNCCRLTNPVSSRASANRPKGFG